MTSKTTYFGQLDPKFLPPPADGRIETQPFLQAATQVPLLFDMLGTAFTPVKMDMNGNITKLQKKYRKDPERFVTFEAMLHEEVENKTTRHKESATISLLWLKRAFEFTIAFLEEIVIDHRNGLKTENMVAFAKKAYENVLKKYHGWMLQKIFSVILRATPWRKDFLKTLAYGKDDQEELVIKDMEEFVAVLSSNIKILQDLFERLDLDFQDKV